MPTSGRILLDGEPLARRSRGPRPLQMVFQDPYSSLDPRMTVGEHHRRGRPHGPAERPVAGARSAGCSNSSAWTPNTPASTQGSCPAGSGSGSPLARALAGRPEVIIADEITSALDVSIQGTVLNLVRDLQRQLGMSMLFISHNLAVVRYVASSIAVMYLGRIVEYGPAAQVLSDPQHPYTRDLLAAVPDSGHALAIGTELDPAVRAVAEAEPADPHHPPAGCSFHPRCPVGPLVLADRDSCRTAEPSAHHRHHAACHFAAPPDPEPDPGEATGPRPRMMTRSQS